MKYKLKYNETQRAIILDSLDILRDIEIGKVDSSLRGLPFSNDTDISHINMWIKEVCGFVKSYISETVKPPEILINLLARWDSDEHDKTEMLVSESELQDISTATDIYSRMRTGQWREILMWIPLRDNIDWSSYHQRTDELSNSLRFLTVSNIDGWSSSLGIYNYDTKEEARIAWDIHQVARHRLSWDRAVKEGVIESVNSPRNWSEVMGVNYDNPMHSGVEPLIEIETIEQ